MNKQIVFVVLVLGLTQAALPACDSATNGFLNNGVCYYRYDPFCKTWAATGCTACATDSPATTPAAATGLCAACTGAAGTDKRNINNAGACVVDATGGATITPPTGNWIQTAAATTHDRRCDATCQHCSTAADATKCTRCWGATADLAAAGSCTGTAPDTLLVPGIGYGAACPAGYVKNASANVCDRCKLGCAACAAADLTKCTGCAEGFLLDATAGTCTAVAANGATGGCDASCGDKKCQNTAKNCTACATGFQLTAAGTCTDWRVPRCKTPTATNDACTDTGCDTGFTLAADKKSCLCPAHQRNTVVAYAAKTASAAEVFYSNTCEACGVTCASPKQCKQDATDKTKDTCVDAAPAPVSNVSVTCADSALVAANCATCADGKCTACLNATLLATDCTKCIADHVKKTATECVPLGSCKAADCTDGKVCGWNTTTSKVECITAPVETTAAATNGLLLSAISMIAALILA